MSDSNLRPIALEVLLAISRGDPSALRRATDLCERVLKSPNVDNATKVSA